ncbi:MAG: hypothetical protein ABWY19_09030 [Marmoricola sp.]
MGIFRKETVWTQVSKPLKKATGLPVVRQGLTAGATVVAVSVASAAASAVRRRQDGA